MPIGCQYFPFRLLSFILFILSFYAPSIFISHGHHQVHITDLGGEKITQRLARVETAAKEGDKGGEKESNDDPQFIKDLLAVHDKYLTMVSTMYVASIALCVRRVLFLHAFIPCLMF